MFFNMLLVYLLYVSAPVSNYGEFMHLKKAIVSKWLHDSTNAVVKKYHVKHLSTLFFHYMYLG